jgi:hypothetical protein
MPEQTFAPPLAAPTDLDGRGFIAEIDRAPLETQPFDHVCLSGLFPPEFYRQLLASIPADECFHELRHRDALRADGSSTRLRRYLYPEQIWRLPAAVRKHWLPLARLLVSRDLQEVFKRKFRRALEARFGCPIDRLRFYPVPIIVRDLPGYRIGIHTDVLKKAITVQFYLPEDDSQRNIGTIFHEGQAGEAALRTRQMPFMPASGYAFPVQQHESWHSAERTSEADGVRRSIMLTYYVQDTAKTWLLRRMDRLRSFFGMHPNPKI